MSGTDTRTTVLDGLVRDGELSEVHADHLGLDLDLVEGLAGVDTDDGADHLGEDDHVTKVGLDERGLLVRERLGLCLAELLDQTHRLALKAAVEPSAGAGMDEVAELLGGEVEEPFGKGLVGVAKLTRKWEKEIVLLELDTAVRELAECSLALELCGQNVSSSPTPLLWPSTGFHPRSRFVACGLETKPCDRTVCVPAASSAFCNLLAMVHCRVPTDIRIRMRRP